MARFLRHDVYTAIYDAGFLPLFYHGDEEIATEIVAACARGGARAIEFTNRGEMAYPVFSALVRRFAKTAPDVILGVGSVVDAPTAAMFIAAGANFIVAPNFNPEIARLCNRRKVAYVPGCMTPTEVATAEEAGAELIKIFPGNIVTPEFIKALLGPCPWSRLMPSSGVDYSAESIGAWLKAGAAVVGMGGKLIGGAVVKEQQWDRLAEMTRQCLAWVQEARR